MKKIVIANWKMNGIQTDWQAWASHAAQFSGEIDNAEVVLCAPAAAFHIVSQHIINAPRISLGAQSIHSKECGAFTGETSLNMLKDFAGDYALVGHSEYRQMRHIEGNQLGEQMRACVRAGVTPVLCIGESSLEREQGKTISVLDEQLEESLKDVHFPNPEDIMIAYEPVWGIGGVNASKTPEVQDVKEVFRFIKSALKERFGDVGLDIPLLYGGSIDAGNVTSFMQELSIQGVLVGSASLKFDVFEAIVRRVNTI